MTRSRAHSEADKQARRDSMLGAAARLFAAQDYASVTMNKVAQESGVAKGTLYLYFATKEELFLELLMVELEAWVDALKASLPRYGGTMEPRRLAALIASLLSARPELVRLLGLMHTVLEHNIRDVDRAADFKLRLLELMQGCGRSLERALAGMRPGDGAVFLTRLHILIVGLGQMTHPAQVICEALERAPELHVMQLDFEAELAAMSEAVLAHMLTAD